MIIGHNGAMTRTTGTGARDARAALIQSEPKGSGAQKKAPAAIAEQIKAAIFAGELHPGDSVKEKWVTATFGPSRATAREAISLLVADRYLVQEPYRSAVVRTFTPQDVRDIMEARQLIEGFAARNCNKATPESKERLRQAFSAYGAATLQHDVAGAAMAHVDLHVAMVGLAGNAALERLCRDLITSALPLIDLINARREDTAKMYDEHLHLTQVMLNGDVEEAVTCVDDHLSMVWRAAREELRHEE